MTTTTLKHAAPIHDISAAMAPLAHGTQTKHLAVLHETVSYNAPGLADIVGVEGVLRREGYGIHGITDREGNAGWSLGHGNDVYWHAGDVNGVAIGIEQISEIPILIQAQRIAHAKAHELWMARPKQLTATAILLACWHNVDPKNHKLVRSDGRIESPGVCSHWEVSQHYASAGGHWDCWPHDRGGYYPLEHVLELAKSYARHYKFPRHAPAAG